MPDHLSRVIPQVEDENLTSLELFVTVNTFCLSSYCAEKESRDTTHRVMGRENFL